MAPTRNPMCPAHWISNETKVGVSSFNLCRCLLNRLIQFHPSRQHNPSYKIKNIELEDPVHGHEPPRQGIDRSSVAMVILLKSCHQWTASAIRNRSRTECYSGMEKAGSLQFRKQKQEKTQSHPTQQELKILAALEKGGPFLFKREGKDKYISCSGWQRHSLVTFMSWSWEKRHYQTIGVYYRGYNGDCWSDVILFLSGCTTPHCTAPFVTPPRLIVAVGACDSYYSVSS